MATLRGNKIKYTYNKLVQVNGNNELQDGLGNLLTGSLGLSGSLILSGSQTIGGNLTVGGNVTAQRFIATTISSSIIYESGSSSFGNSLDDTHIFSGSILLEGSQSISGPLTLGVIQDVSSSIDTISTSVTTLSGSAHNQRVALISDLSGSAHTARRSEINDLSGSAHSQRVSEITLLSSSVDTHLDSNISALSSSAHTARINEITNLSGSAHNQRIAISSSLKNYTDTKIADLVDGAPALLDTLNELAAAIGDDAAISASFASTLSTKASITQLNNSSSVLLGDIDTLSGSAHIQRVALYNSSSGDTSALSGSAHTQRVAISSSFASTQALQDGRLSSIENFTASLDNTYATDAELASATSSLSSSAHTQRVALDTNQTTALTNLSSSFVSTLDTLNAPTATSASYATTASHALNVPATASYAISSSYAVTASFALNVSEGTGFPFTGSAIITGSLEVVGGTITGDGSGITNLAIDAQSSYYQSFSGQTSLTVNHGLASKNVIVTVYNTLDQQIVPASITTTDVNNVSITFDSSTSGRVGVTRGGHIISASSLLTLTPVDILPSGVPTGSLAVSGSIAKLYFYNGNSINGWKEIAFV